MDNWLIYFLRKSIAQRKGRFALSSVAVMLAVGSMTALATVSIGVRDKIGLQLRQYGANMMVTDASGGEIPMDTANQVLSSSAHIKDAAFHVYGTSRVKGLSVEIIGMEAQRMGTYRVAGRMPRGEDEIMVGINLKEALSIEAGMTMRLGDGKAYTVTGIFERGSEEDSAVVMTLGSAQRLFKIDAVSAILINGDTRYLGEIERAVSQRFPRLRVKTLRQVAVAEERVLDRIEMLMLVVSLIVLFSSSIALGSTMAASIIERMEEIGLMKALGATRRDILGFFVSEAAAAGLAGSLSGYVFGVLSAEAVSVTAFGSFIAPRTVFLPAAAIFGLIISVLSAVYPVRDALKIGPAVILRGE